MKVEMILNNIMPFSKIHKLMTLQGRFCSFGTMEFKMQKVLSHFEGK
jgi:hypothetical protein